MMEGGDAPPAGTSDTPAEGDFYSAGTGDTVVDMAGDISGEISPTAPAAKPAALDAAAPESSTVGGLAQNNGFGWMMELEEEEEELKPLLEELDIDLKDIWHKVRCVLLPVDVLGFERAIVRDSPDFWGPLLVVCLYAMLSMYGNWKAVSWILTIWAIGSFLVFFLVRVMGADVTFSQTLGVIGYSLLPLTVMMTTLPIVGHVAIMAYFVKIIGVLWSSQSAGSLLVTEDIASKKVMVLYPIALLYGYFLSLHTGA